MNRKTSDTAIPETHELVRQEDVEETLEIFRQGNTVIQALDENQLAWLRIALETRRTLCAGEFDADGHVDAQSREQRNAWDREINKLDTNILKVQHYLSRLRALIPALMTTRRKYQATTNTTDESQKHISQMMYDCSMAEAQSAIQGLAALRIHPHILDEMK